MGLVYASVELSNGDDTNVRDPKRGELVVNPKHPFKRGGPLK